MSEAMQLVTRVASELSIAAFALTVVLFVALVFRALVFRALVPKRRKAEPGEGAGGVPAMVEHLRREQLRQRRRRYASSADEAAGSRHSDDGKGGGQ